MLGKYMLVTALAVYLITVAISHLLGYGDLSSSFGAVSLLILLFVKQLVKYMNDD